MSYNVDAFTYGPTVEKWTAIQTQLPSKMWQTKVMRGNAHVKTFVTVYRTSGARIANRIAHHRGAGPVEVV